MKLFRTSKRCYVCGGTYELRRCSCGRYYCPAHGFGGKCLECQKASVGAVSAPLRRETESFSKPSPSATRGHGRRPKRIEASIHHDAPDRDHVQHRLARNLNLWRRVLFEPVKVEQNHGITCYFKSSHILWKIEVGDHVVGVTTDLSNVSGQYVRQWEKSGAAKKGEEGGFAYVARFVHNETLFICEVVLRSSGAKVVEVKNDLPMIRASPRELGTCPWCGTISRGLSKCPNCGKEIPDDMDLRTLLKIHYRRQIMGELIALRTSRMKDEEKQLRMSEAKTELRVLEEM